MHHLTSLQSIGNGGVVRDVQMVNKKSLMNYMGDTHVPFLKITLSDQRSLPKIRDKCYSFRLSEILDLPFYL